MKQNRECRDMRLNIIKRDGDEPSFLVEGYASTFEPYVMFSDGEIDYCERIEPEAFEDTDFSDVVFRVDHEGAVYARTSAGTIDLSVDEKGLHNVTDLSKTASARSLYEDIAAGNYPKMSFAFTVAKDHYEKESHTRVIDSIAKVYDISPVSFPANPGTSLSCRDYFNGVIEAERAERLEAEERVKELEKLNQRKENIRKKLLRAKLEDIL